MAHNRHQHAHVILAGGSDTDGVHKGMPRSGIVADVILLNVAAYEAGRRSDSRMLGGVHFDEIMMSSSRRVRARHE